jgi:hypothetical protein
MKARAAVRIAWLVWMMSIASLVASFWFGLAAHKNVPFDPGELPILVAFGLFVLAFATVGAFVASKLPRNPIGWIMAGSGFAYALAGSTLSYAEYGIHRASGASLPLELLLWVAGWAWIVGSGPAGTFLLLLFPDGNLPSRRWRPIAWLAGTAILLVFASIAFVPGEFPDYPGFENPAGIPGAKEYLPIVGGIGGLALVVSVLASVLSMVFRFRRSGSLVRQQLKWLTYAAALVALCLVGALIAEPLAGSTDLANLLVTGALTAVPVAIGIAILRHRVYDIDVVINRTLVYGVLTATLGLVYVGLVAGIGTFAGESNLVVAGSTLAVAALFQPARTRIQAFIDRRFNRQRYDAARTIETFSSRLRDEIDLDTLSAELLAVARSTMQPARASLWLRRTEEVKR